MDVIAIAEELYDEHKYAVIGGVLIVFAIILISFAYYWGWIGGPKSGGPLDNEEEFNGLIASIHAKQKPRKK